MATATSFLISSARRAESDVFMPHFPQGLQCMHGTVIIVAHASDPIVNISLAIYADTNPDFRESLAQLDNPLAKKSIGVYHNPVAFSVKRTHDIRQIRPHEGFSTGKVG